MQAQKRAGTIQDGVHRLFSMPGAKPAAINKEENRGLRAPVRFFIDYSISVAVAAVARKQALRAKLTMSSPSGLVLSVVVSTLSDQSGFKFVAYSDDMYRFLSSSTGLFVINQTPRELEHSIYLYLSERLAGQESVSVELCRESNSLYGLPVLVGCSDEGPRSLAVRAG